jgi:hypothetical protein
MDIVVYIDKCRYKIQEQVPAQAYRHIPAHFEHYVSLCITVTYEEIIQITQIRAMFEKKALFHCLIRSG